MIDVSPIAISAKSNLRKVKTYAADAYLLGELYYKEEFQPFSVQLLNLRYLTRQYESLSKMCDRINCNFKLFWIRFSLPIKVSSELCIQAFH